mmetsp:Transcript_39225/g.77172  ORF Transcript_39225/g.77172 Transcript_39225/m.77172 type:complete len:97 (+) Transcript_39225:4636-4926(+)
MTSSFLFFFIFSSKEELQAQTRVGRQAGSQWKAMNVMEGKLDRRFNRTQDGQARGIGVTISLMKNERGTTITQTEGNCTNTQHSRWDEKTKKGANR